MLIAVLKEVSLKKFYDRTFQLLFQHFPRNSVISFCETDIRMFVGKVLYFLSSHSRPFHVDC